MSHPAPDDVRPSRAALVDELRKAGAIRSPEWAEAFATVPRHVFVPTWYRHMALQLQRRDGSWARFPLTGEHLATVTYGGAADLWEQTEAGWLWWNDHGRPAQDRFGYVREADGREYAWRIPDGRRWPLAV